MRGGYTHRITWSEWHKFLRCWVEKTFPTTADAVALHVAGLKVRGITPVVTKI